MKQLYTDVDDKAYYGKADGDSQIHVYPVVKQWSDGTGREFVNSCLCGKTQSGPVIKVVTKYDSENACQECVGISRIDKRM